MWDWTYVSYYQKSNKTVAKTHPVIIDYSTTTRLLPRSVNNGLLRGRQIGQRGFVWKRIRGDQGGMSEGGKG